MLLSGLPAAAIGQTTTGTIAGRVTDSTGLPVAGVSVTAASESLQGTSHTVTSERGDYILTLLPPGVYVLGFHLDGFEPQQRAARLAPGQHLPVDVALGPASVTDTLEVTAPHVDVMLRTAQAATTFSRDALATLPTTRDVHAALLMAPSVHSTGPSGAVSMAGAMSFENLFLLNGATINENLRGQPHDLYIEDAIQEVTVATSGISAEFGRFGGGVVNLITRSGGNAFGGSFRTTLTNDRWRAHTPFEQAAIAADPAGRDTRADATIPIYEYTFGGPAVRDRLWFFAAGRHVSQETGRTLAVTNIPYVYREESRRLEGNATVSVAAGHRLQGSVSAVSATLANDTFQPATSMDLNSLYTSSRPMGLATLNYTGILSRNFFVDLRHSRRTETLEGLGGTSRDLVEGTLLIDGQRGTRFWAPTLCGVCDPEERNNDNLFAKGSYFLSTDRAGSHTVVFGYDRFDDERLANNHQSGSGYRIGTSGAIVSGAGPDAVIYPQFLANNTALIVWQPILTESRGSRFRTHSLFVNDNWRASARVTANLGLRYDRNSGRNSVGDRVVVGGAWSPRLGVVIDPAGGGRWTLSASAARYVAAVANTIADSTSPGGNADAYAFLYQGPAINANPDGPLVGTADALRQVFDWFFANGGASRPLAAPPVIRGVTPRIDRPLVSPSVIEYAGGVARLMGGRGAVRADATYRDYRDFYALRTDTTTGQVSDSTGRMYDLTVVENTDLLKRRYAGLSLQATSGWERADAGLSYTLSRTWGNVEGETVNAGPAASGALQYPEYKQAAWSHPEGDLPVDQRHRARAWLNYRLPGVEGVTVSVLQWIESGVPYGAVSTAGVNVLPHVANPGYLTPPAPNQTVYFFTAPDAFRTEGQRRTDLGISYVQAPGRQRVRLFAQLQILNVFNQSQLCGCGGTVTQNGSGVNRNTIDQVVRTSVTQAAVYQTFNPFTGAPMRGVNWDLGPNFGRALNRFAHTTPRALRITAGVRF